MVSRLGKGFTSKWAVCLLLLLSYSALHAQVTYVYTDPQGTPLAEADAHGNITATYDYAPHGSQALGTPPNGPGYTGHVNDPDTGLVYMQARYYDPSTGRFLSVDPVRPSVGNSFNFNRYAYANNNPIVNIDPNGKSVTCDSNSCTIVAHNLLEEAVGYGYVGGVILQRAIQNAINPSPAAPTAHNQSQGDAPALPGGLVGTNDGKGGQQGGRINSGPLDPAHGGTGDAEKDFGKLTGGEAQPAPSDSKFPAGTILGDNGVIFRPSTTKDGPRIDIPANGDKPHETLHYPTPPPPPPPPPNTSGGAN
ncbi:MAG TPA: RHS repeat-associated core domain-containing protein [Rhodanobacter sp.]|jgi:RHS repeat-associated protein|nr:RHS repeat-associated core domain-containing protein [Rhodanobacter sp.]